MGWNVAQKLIAAHLLPGEMTPGGEIGLRVDQTLTQDATGMLVILELEALGLQRPRQVHLQHPRSADGPSRPQPTAILRSRCSPAGARTARSSPRCGPAAKCSQP